MVTHRISHKGTRHNIKIDCMTECMPNYQLSVSAIKPVTTEITTEYTP